VVIDALEGTRPAAVELFVRARAGIVDVAFSTRLEYELRRHTLDEVRALVSRTIAPLGSTGRYGASRYDDGDTYAADESPLMLPPTAWRLGFGQMGVDISTPTLQGIGSLRGLDSDHLEAHRRSGRDVFVTSDTDQLKAARQRSLNAATPEELLARLAAHTPDRRGD
jgi:hypothetical protein